MMMQETLKLSCIGDRLLKPEYLDRYSHYGYVEEIGASTPSDDYYCCRPNARSKQVFPVYLTAGQYAAIRPNNVCLIRVRDLSDDTTALGSDLGFFIATHGYTKNSSSSDDLPVFEGDTSRVSSYKKPDSEKKRAVLSEAFSGYPHAERIKNRLLYLIDADDFIEEGEDEVSLGSIRQFIGFIKTARPAYPDIVVTPYGNIRAEWWENNTKFFNVEFIPSGECKVVAFLSDPTEQGKPLIISKKIKAHEIIELAVTSQFGGLVVGKVHS